MRPCVAACLLGCVRGWIAVPEPEAGGGWDLSRGRLPAGAGAAEAYSVGMAHLRCRQASCGAKSKSLSIGRAKTGLFASMFQLMARKFQCALHPTNYCVAFNQDASPAADGPVVIDGHFKWYTENAVCKARRDAVPLDCHFEPMALGGAECERGAAPAADACGALHDPGVEFRGTNWNSAWWWGVVQAYVSRPNNLTKEAVSALEQTWGVSADFRPDVALHVRVGGKLERPPSVTPQLYLDEAWAYVAAARAKSLQPCTRRAHIFVATDSLEVLPAVHAWADGHAADVSVHVQEDTATQLFAKGPHETHPLNGTDHHRAAVEIITDMHFLSRATVIFGMYCSQIARAAANRGYAAGLTLDAVALDRDASDRKMETTTALNKFMLTADAEGWRAKSDPPRETPPGFACH
ncbi:hypothetical protein M885DRAFT_535937 [Pelagophyceae sp. CCMP2097]|nr:hypothetical protein M885DRAFT_535937 [Pelagophyceae sp. CCMP2097]